MSPKQDEVFERAKKLFGDKMDDDAALVARFKIHHTQDINHVAYTDEMIRGLLNDIVYPKADNNLYVKYVMPPFSVLDTKGGEWQKRKADLDAYLGSSLAGRGKRLAFQGEHLKVRADDNGTSQFDSVLCEVLLKWYGYPGCCVFDPFAGGHVRGTMAAMLGYSYQGIDLSGEQIEANRLRYHQMDVPGQAVWHHDDSRNADMYVMDGTADLIFTCPPYGSLEKYTDHPADLSNMDDLEFDKVYHYIINLACRKLRDDRFAVVVVGNYRDSKGFMRDLCGLTIQAFEAAGARYYNDIVLLNNPGTAPMRASTTFANRKVVKLHQNVLVFYKGNPQTIQDRHAVVDAKLPFKTAKQNTLL